MAAITLTATSIVPYTFFSLWLPQQQQTKLFIAAVVVKSTQPTHSGGIRTATTKAQGWITLVKYTAQTAHKGHWQGLSRTIIQ